MAQRKNKLWRQPDIHFCAREATLEMILRNENAARGDPTLIDEVYASGYEKKTKKT